MKTKLSVLLVSVIGLFMFSGCGAGFSETADPKLVAQGKNGPYPTNYKAAAQKVWKVSMKKGIIYPDSITTSKPVKAYSRGVNGKPEFFGYFVRTCAKYKDGRERNCAKIIVKKNCSDEFWSNSKLELWKADDKGCFLYLRRDPFFKEPWYIRQPNDMN